MAVVAYLRVSATDQNLTRQRELVGPVFRTFEEKVSGASTERPALKACMDYLRDESDTLRVASIDRLARDSRDLHSIVAQLNAKGVTVQFVEENLTITGDGAVGNLIMSIFAAVAEFERRKIKERQRQGIEAAKRRGVYAGRRSRKALRASSRRTRLTTHARGRGWGCRTRWSRRSWGSLVRRCMTL